MGNDVKSDNELIAEFMGFKYHKNYGYIGDVRYDDEAVIDPVDPKFVQIPHWNDSWDWLIPVAQKIKDLTYKDLKAQELPTFQQAVARWRAAQNEISNLKIEAAHYCVVKWIEWYNSQPK